MEEARSLLKIIREPDLYCNTCYYEVNVRNQIILFVLELAQNKEITLPNGVDWVCVVNTVIEYFGRVLDLTYILNPINGECTKPEILTAFSGLLSIWEKELRKVGKCDVKILRKQIVANYMKMKGMDPECVSVNAVLKSLAENTIYCDKTGLARAFSACHPNASRAILAKGALAMKATIKETNHLLRQANLPVLYLRDDEVDDELFRMADENDPYFKEL